MRMKRMLCGGLRVLALALGFCAQARAQSTPLDAAKMFLTAFNAGDTAKAASLGSASGMVIVDEFAPHLWTGKSAFASWSADYDKDARIRLITDPMVTMDAPLVSTVDGDTAYLVCPMTYLYKQKGVAMREPARMAMVLHKEGGVWRFASWTWAGTVPRTAVKK